MNDLIPTPAEATRRMRAQLHDMVDCLADGALKNGEDHTWFEALLVFNSMEGRRRLIQRTPDGDVPMEQRDFNVLKQLMIQASNKQLTDAREQRLRERGVIA